jgi:hypothetical protein
MKWCAKYFAITSCIQGLALTGNDRPARRHRAVQTAVEFGDRYRFLSYRARSSAYASHGRRSKSLAGQLFDPRWKIIVDGQMILN